MSIDPFTAMAASTALTGAGSLLDSGASARRTGAINSGRNRLFQEEMNRQNGFSAEAWPIFQGAADKRGAAKSGERYQQYVDKRVADTSAPIVSPVTVGGAPQQVNNEIQRVAHNVGEVAAANARAKAKLEGYGDVAAEDSRDTIRAGSKLNTISDFARSSASILPAEFESNDYNAARENQDSLGSIFKMLGMGAGLYGAFSPAVGAGMPSAAAFEGVLPGMSGSEARTYFGQASNANGGGWFSRMFK